MEEWGQHFKNEEFEVLLVMSSIRNSEDVTSRGKQFYWTGSTLSSLFAMVDFAGSCLQSVRGSHTLTRHLVVLWWCGPETVCSFLAVRTHGAPLIINQSRAVLGRLQRRSGGKIVQNAQDLKASNTIIQKFVQRMEHENVRRQEGIFWHPSQCQQFQQTSQCQQMPPWRGWNGSGGRGGQCDPHAVLEW